MNNRLKIRNLSIMPKALFFSVIYIHYLGSNRTHMRKYFTLLILSIVLSLSAVNAQLNITVTNSVANNIMFGNYNPATYIPSVVIDHPDSISAGILRDVSPDSLKAYIIQLSTFHNRNSGADTVSNTTGIGAARKWVYSKFSQYSAVNENRLLPFYLQFDKLICTMDKHKDICAILPGTDTSYKGIIIIEGHIDSRCEGVCDITCSAQGIEDNASGTALVMELARVMSKYTYKHSIVFIITIGEEQGLYGADAFADYTSMQGIEVKAVQNNDVIGGILCGETSSPPSCPGLGNVDSTHVRIFSQGAFNSKNKGYARFCKLEYQEQLLPHVDTPMDILIMTPEDRTGRSGDHVPFRQKGYASIRFSSANEHGDANVADTAYSDRQHTTRDTLGVDTDADMIIDSFFVDFRYLARNAYINGNASAMCAVGPRQPDFQLTAVGANKIRVEVTVETQYDAYRVGVRSSTNDWDTVFTMTNTLIDTFDVSSINNVVYVSIMSVDDNFIESIPSRELTVNISSIEDQITEENHPIQLFQNKPNPFDESTYIQFFTHEMVTYKKAEIQILSVNGVMLKSIPVEINQGLNEVMYTHGYGATGLLYYSLIVDGKVVGTKAMVFAN